MTTMSELDDEVLVVIERLEKRITDLETNSREVLASLGRITEIAGEIVRSMAKR